MQVWETGDREAIRREVLRKLNAAKGGGFIFHIRPFGQQRRVRAHLRLHRETGA